MGSVISWLYAEMITFGNWIDSVWQTLVIEERQHPYLLALAAIIVLTFVLSLICNLCACLWSICCSKSPNYTFANRSIANNYGTIQPIVPPGENRYPYNPEIASAAAGPSGKSGGGAMDMV